MQKKDDPISKYEIIDAIKECAYEIDGYYCTYDRVINEEDAIEAINSLSPTQPESQWIPCSERLPENEYVLISKKPTKISGSKWSVDIAIRTSDPRSGKIQWRDSGFGVIQDDKVLAWMPLPEPYTEREEE